MKIVKSELKKILKNKVIIIALSLFIALNLFNIYRNCNISNDVPDYYNNARLTIQQQLDGELTKDKINLINAKVYSLSIQANGEYAEQKSLINSF